jgi:hypothetical protein
MENDENGAEKGVESDKKHYKNVISITEVILSYG